MTTSPYNFDQPSSDELLKSLKNLRDDLDNVTPMMDSAKREVTKVAIRSAIIFSAVFSLVVFMSTAAVCGALVLFGVI